MRCLSAMVILPIQINVAAAAINSLPTFRRYKEAFHLLRAKYLCDPAFQLCSYCLRRSHVATPHPLPLQPYKRGNECSRCMTTRCSEMHPRCIPDIYYLSAERGAEHISPMACKPNTIYYKFQLCERNLVYRFILQYKLHVKARAT